MKSTIIAALLGFLLPVIGIMGFNAWTDPFRYYRPIEDSRYSDNARWQNPGMIRNSPYDTALIGTSRFENFKPSMFADAGWKVLKVTAPGSLANEQLDTMEMVLEQGRAKRIIIEMSYVSYIASRQRDPGEFPRFLYRSTPETSFRGEFSATDQAASCQLRRQPARKERASANARLSRSPGSSGSRPSGCRYHRGLLTRGCNNIGPSCG